MSQITGSKLLREDFIHALEEIGTFVDITVDDLMDVNSRAEKYARKRITENFQVSDIMKAPVETMKKDGLLLDLAELFVTHRISGVPVINDQGQLVGLVTEADLLRALGLTERHPSHSLWHSLENMFSHHLDLREVDGEVGDVMTTNVVTVTPEQTLHDVLSLMNKHSIKRVVVCDSQQQVVGMITRSDLVRAFLKQIKRK